MQRRRSLVAVPVGRIDHDRRRRGFGRPPELLRQRAHELAQRRLHFRGCRRRPGHHEQRSGLGRGEPAQVGTRPAHERPTAAASGLGVHRDSGHAERFEIPAGCALRRPSSRQSATYRPGPGVPAAWRQSRSALIFLVSPVGQDGHFRAQHEPSPTREGATMPGQVPPVADEREGLLAYLAQQRTSSASPPTGSPTSRRGWLPPPDP